MIRRFSFLSVLMGAAAAGLAAALSCGTVSAATFSTTPAADTFVSTGAGGTLSGNNYGGAGAIAVSAPGLPQGELQSIIQFNLSGAVSSFNSTFGAGQWSVQSATLQLTASAPNNGVFNSSAAGLLGISWMQNDSWQEGAGTPGAPGATGISFTSLPGFLSGADENLGSFNFTGATSGAFTYTLSLTSGFTGDLLAGGNVSLRMLAGDTSVSGVFSSRSFGTASARPTLTIVAVPEAGTAVLSGAGMLLLALRRSRG